MRYDISVLRDAVEWDRQKVRKPGIRLRRDNWVLVRYAEELNSAKSLSHPTEDRPTWDFGTKACPIVKYLRDHGTQSMRRLAQKTGLSKSSVHRLQQAMARRGGHPESWLWRTEGCRQPVSRAVGLTAQTLRRPKWPAAGAMPRKTLRFTMR